jgi:FkbM family methyltransferase
MINRNQIASIIQKKKFTLKKNIPIAIFGTGTFAYDLYKALNIKGYTVDFFVEKQKFIKKRETYGECKIISDLHLIKQKKQIQVLVGIHNRDADIYQIELLLKQNQNLNIALPQEYYYLFEDILGWRFWLSSANFLLKTTNVNKLNKIFKILADNESKNRLLDIFYFRLGLKNEYGCFVDMEKQYFNNLTISDKKKKISYCDIGAYDGDTILEAINEMNVSELYAFEPSKTNYKKLLKRINHLDIPNICLPLGVSNKFNELSFMDSEQSNEAGRIGEAGNKTINVISLDNSFNTSLNFIKIDVEGFEKDVIDGATKLIRKHLPVMAISLYHNAWDLWELPSLIKKINPSYNLYIRQHGFNSFDCILYAIPF